MWAILPDVRIHLNPSYQQICINVYKQAAYLDIYTACFELTKDYRKCQDLSTSHAEYGLNYIMYSAWAGCQLRTFWKYCTQWRPRYQHHLDLPHKIISVHYKSGASLSKVCHTCLPQGNRGKRSRLSTTKVLAVGCIHDTNCNWQKPFILISTEIVVLLARVYIKQQ